MEIYKEKVGNSKIVFVCVLFKDSKCLTPIEVTFRLDSQYAFKLSIFYY